jgi:hypothetical protein
MIFYFNYFVLYRKIRYTHFTHLAARQVIAPHTAKRGGEISLFTGVSGTIPVHAD